MSSWGRLYRSLRDPLPSGSYRLGMSLERIEQDAEGVTAVFADGARVTRRPAGRRRRPALHGARAAPARAAAQLCRLRRLARHARGERGAARHPRARSSSATPSACPRASCCWPIRCPAATTRRSPAAAPTTSSGTGRPIRTRRWSISAPTPAAAVTARSIPPPLIRPRGHGGDQGDGARARGAAGRRDFRARAAAVLPADLRSRIAAHGVRTGGAAGRRRVRGAARMSAPASPRRRSTPRASPTPSADGDLAAGLERYQREQQPFGRGAGPLGREEGAYLSAQLKPREQRSAAELERDITRRALRAQFAQREPAQGAGRRARRFVKGCTI